MSILKNIFGSSQNNETEDIRELINTEPKSTHLQNLLSLPHNIAPAIFSSISNGKAMDYTDAETRTTIAFEPKDYTEDDITWAREVMALISEGENLANAGSCEKAIPVLIDALKIAPGNDLILLTLGVCYAKIDKFRIALEIMKKAKLLYPHNKRISNNYEAIKSAS